MCQKVGSHKPYELTQVSFVGGKNNTLSVCRNCAYKETYGTKNMRKKMKEREIEEKSD